MTGSAAEDRLAGLLTSQLAPPWAIYRNAAWLEKQPGREPADGEADLVVAHPGLGVMVIEVKGGGVRRVNGRWESVDRNGTAHQIKDPFAQVTREMHALRRVCERLPEWPVHSVPFCRAVALPDAAYPRQLVPDGPSEIVFDADDLATGSALGLEARLREIFAWWQADPEYPGRAPGDIGCGRCTRSWRATSRSCRRSRSALPPTRRPSVRRTNSSPSWTCLAPSGGR